MNPFFGVRRGRSLGINRSQSSRRMPGSYMANDGINRSRVVTNMSTVEDRFQIRREKISNMSGTSAFTLAQSLYVNPGNTVLFPIFSQIAATYEEYRCNFLEFTFETDAYTATNGTASAGKVILATNFDPDDSAFSNDTQMENYVGSCKGPPYAPIIKHDVVQGFRARNNRRQRGDLALNNYFVYSSANQIAPGTGQGKFYDMGLFQAATAGNAVTTEIGELYVTYSFTMIRPKQQTPLGQNFLSAHYTGVPTTSNPFAGAVLESGSNLSLTITNTTHTLPSAGRWLCQYIVRSATTAVTLTSNSLGTGLTSVDFFQTENDGNNVIVGAAAQAAALYSYVVDSTVQNGVVTGATHTIVGAAVFDLIITQVSSGLNFIKEKGSLSHLDEKEREEEFMERILSRLKLKTDEDEESDYKEPLMSVRSQAGSPKGLSAKAKNRFF